MKQSSIFDFMFEKKLIKKPIRIIELFGELNGNKNK
jgi:hypothetical protein